jgi:hypothetical protein
MPVSCGKSGFFVVNIDDLLEFGLDTVLLQHFLVLAVFGLFCITADGSPDLIGQWQKVTVNGVTDTNEGPP